MAPASIYNRPQVPLDAWMREAVEVCREFPRLPTTMCSAVAYARLREVTAWQTCDGKWWA
jgi:hypothetical protein